MSTDIKIMAEPSVMPDACKFTVDRPVYEGGAAHFSSKDSAQGSILPEALFAIDGVAGVSISGNTITVKKSGPEDWRALAPRIGAAIRSQLQTGKPLISQEFIEKLSQNDKVRTKIQLLFDNEVNPAIAAHGGYVDLIDVKDNKVYIQMSGGCQGCSSSLATLKLGIEASIKQLLPEIEEVLDATDHAAGTNPYYQ